jgi:hypothetical protein
MNKALYNKFIVLLTSRLLQTNKIQLVVTPKLSSIVPKIQMACTTEIQLV